MVWQEIIESPYVTALFEHYRKELKLIFRSYAQADQVTCVAAARPA